MQTVTLAKFVIFGREATMAGVVASLCIAAGATGAFAQEAPVASPSGVAAPAVVKEDAVTKPDYALLLRALQGLKDTAALGYSSRSTLQGATKGVTVLGHQKLDMVALRDGKLRVDVSVWLGDDPKDARTYTVVGDGTQLFTYRPAKMQYSVKSFDMGKLQDETSRLGILGALYYNQDVSNLVNNTTPETVDATFEQIQALGIRFSETKLGETPIYTVKMTPPNASPPVPDKDAKAGETKKAEAPPTLTLRFYVDPDTAQFRQLEMTGQQGENRLTIVEKIVRQTNRPVYESPAFRFTPTAKDVKVADVPVDLFKE